jgi:hypothetical protein
MSTSISGSRPSEQPLPASPVGPEAGTGPANEVAPEAAAPPPDLAPTGFADGTSTPSALISDLDLSAIAQSLRSSVQQDQTLAKLLQDPRAAPLLRKLGVEDTSGLIDLADRLAARQQGGVDFQLDKLLPPADQALLANALAGKPPAAPAPPASATTRSATPPGPDKAPPRPAAAAAQAPRPATSQPPPPGLPKSPADLAKIFPELKGKSKEDLQKTYDALTKLVTGNTSDQLGALATLSAQFPESLGAVLQQLGIKDAKVTKLVNNKDILGSLSKLSDPKAPVAAKIQAALKLTSSASGVLKLEEVSSYLKTTLGGIAPADKLVGAIASYADPAKTGVQKAKATLELATAIKDFAGKEFPAVANDLRKLDGSFRAAGAALTLVDPEASAGDKALAAAQLAAELPDLKKDLTAFGQLLKGAGVENASEVAQGAAMAAEVPVKGLAPRVAKELNPGQVAALKAAAEKVGADKLEPALRTLTDPKAIDALASRLATLDPAAGKRFLQLASGLERSVLEKALLDPAASESIGKLASKLDDEAAKVLGKLVKDFDSGALSTLLKIADKAPVDLLGKTIKLLQPALDKGGSKLLGASLKLLDSVFSRLGVQITADVAGKVLKNLTKAVPLVGAVPGVIDAALYAKEAVQLQGKNKDLGYFALVGAQLNGADAIVGTILDFTGVGAAVNAVVGVGFGVAELAIDIAFQQEKAKLEKDPANYKAPDWLKAVNVAFSATQGPLGLANLAAYYGPEGAAQLLEWGAEKGAKGATELFRAAGVESANEVGRQAKVASAAIHQLADVIRNPTKYGTAVVKRAVQSFNAAIKQGGAIASEARRVLGTVLDEAGKLASRGLTKGFETLRFIATQPGDAARLAINEVKQLVTSGIDLAKKGGTELLKRAVTTLESIKAGYRQFKGEARRQIQSFVDGASQAISTAVEKAKAAGAQGLAFLSWAATHRGEIAQQAKQVVVDTLKRGGEVARQAWQEIKGLGNRGIKLAETAIRELKNAGEQGVEVLKYIASDPGAAGTKALEAVGQTLNEIARQGGQAAVRAAEAIKQFVDNRQEWAKKFAVGLLKDGVASFKEVASAWRQNVTEGAKDVINALRDLQDAGVDALKDLARAGGPVGQLAVTALGQAAQAGSTVAGEALRYLHSLGGEIGRVTESTYNRLKAASNGEFTIRGVKFDLNPFW